MFFFFISVCFFSDTRLWILQGFLASWPAFLESLASPKEKRVARQNTCCRESGAKCWIVVQLAERSA